MPPMFRYHGPIQDFERAGGGGGGGGGLRFHIDVTPVQCMYREFPLSPSI